MYTIKSFSISQQSTYVSFVSAQERTSFLQSWSWGAFQASLGRAVHRLGVYKDTQLVGTAQFIETKVPLLHGIYWYAPYGPLLQTDDPKEQQEIISALIVHIQKSYAVWFVRFEPSQNIVINTRSTIRTQPGATAIIDLKPTEERILNSMHPKTRYNIRVGLRHGVRVESEILAVPLHGLRLRECMALFSVTSKRQGFKSHPTSYYEALITFFTLHHEHNDCAIKLYKALYKNELIACALMIDHGRTRTYLFGGSTERHKEVMAPYAMHWHAIHTAKSHGLSHYDLWGVETSTGKTPGFVRFKLGWGGQRVEYPLAKDIVFNRPWYTIYTMLRKLNRLFSWVR